MNTKIYQRLLSIAMVIISTQLTAQVKIKNDVLPLDPAVRTGKLPNGFIYYIRHNEEPKDRVLMYLVNKAGSVLEDEDQRGLAHFMEHMSFNGTTNFPHNQMVDYLQKAGVRFGADINAYTSFDETVYELPLPSNKPELLNGGIEIMRDWAQNATLDPEEIEKERGVVLEEKRLGKGARERMRQKYFPLVLNNSRYTVRVPIGLDTVLNNFKQPVIARFYKDWYRPDLQALIIVGDIDVDLIERTIKAEFSDLKNPVNERARTKYTIPLDGKNKFIVVTDKEMAGTEAQIIIKHKMPPLKTAGDYRNLLIQGLFNRMLTGRYTELSKQSDPPFIQGSASISGVLGDLNGYNITVRLKPDNLESGIKAVWRETESLKRFGFTLTELERAKTTMLNAAESALRENNKTNSSNYVNEYKEFFLNNIAAPGVEKEYQLINTYLPGISLTDLNNLAADYIRTTNRDIVLLAAEKDKSSLPDETVVNNWLKAVEMEKLVPYRDDVSSKPLLSTLPIPGKIKSEAFNALLNTTTLILSNGVKVLLKPTNFKNDEIIFNGFAPGGTSLYNDADYPSALNAANIIQSSGAGNYNRNELSKYMEGKQLSIGTYIDELNSGMMGSSTPKYLETIFQLIYARMTEPKKDSTAFKGMITRAKAGLRNRANDPATVYRDTVYAVLNNHSIRRTAPTLESLEAINLDKAYQIYKERFADAANFSFTFVGSIDMKTIKPLLEKYLGSLPATGKNEQPADLNINPPAGRIEKIVYKGSEPKASVTLVYSGSYDDNFKNNMKMIAMNEVLQIRLLQRLREEESGVYSPGAELNTAKLPQQRYSLTIHFGCAPQNVEKLIASTLDEINKLKTDGPLQENINKWRAEDKTSFEPQLKTNDFWSGYLSGQLQNHESLEQINHFSEVLNSVTTADVKDVAEKYLSGANFIKLILLPDTAK